MLLQHGVALTRTTNENQRIHALRMPDFPYNAYQVLVCSKRIVFDDISNCADLTELVIYVLVGVVCSLLLLFIVVAVVVVR